MWMTFQKLQVQAAALELCRDITGMVILELLKKKPNLLSKHDQGTNI